MRGLRILILGPYPLQPGRVLGGVESVTSTLAGVLSSLPEIENVTVLSMFHSPYHAKTEKITDKLQVIHLPGQNKLALPTRAFMEFSRARQIVRMIKPDIVHGQGIGILGDIAIRLSQRPVITIHGLVHVEARMASGGTFRDRSRSWLVEQMVRRVLRRARLVISTTGYDARAVHKWIHGPHITIANPVPAELFKLASSQATGGTILFAGTLVRRKNIEGLLRAFARVSERVPNARLVIVGPTPDPVYQREILEMVKTLHLGTTVVFRGLVENRELLSELIQSQCLVLFSHEETSPTIIAQAMAAGLPVVASGVGGIPEMISNGENGFLVNPGDEQNLSARLIELLQSPELCKRMGSQGHEFARERFEPVLVAQKTTAAYRSLLEG